MWTLKNIIDFNSRLMYYVSEIIHLCHYKELRKTALVYLCLNYPHMSL
jgi:hypothetical protein